MNVPPVTMDRLTEAFSVGATASRERFAWEVPSPDSMAAHRHADSGPSAWTDLARARPIGPSCRQPIAAAGVETGTVNAEDCRDGRESDPRDLRVLSLLCLASSAAVVGGIRFIVLSLT